MVDLNGHTENDGAIQDGAAISIVNRPGYKGLDKAAITGGTFTAQGNNGAALKAYSWDSSTKQESPFVNADNTATVSDGEFNGNLDLGNIEVSGGKFTDKTVAQHLKRGLAVLFSDGKYAVADEETAKDDATYSVTNADGTVVYFTDAQSANDYAKESGAQAPKVLKVTVTFDSNQGTAVDSQLVAVGDKVAKPADPTRKGYVFSGWFTNEDCATAYDFDAAVDGAEPEFTLYAGWKAEAQPGAGENGATAETPLPMRTQTPTPLTATAPTRATCPRPATASILSVARLLWLRAVCPLTPAMGRVPKRRARYETIVL